MNPVNKKPLEAKGLHQHLTPQTGHAQLFKPGVAQTKTAVSAQSGKRPDAPPVYRPQAKPNAVQQKIINGSQIKQQHVVAPVYRYQPAPNAEQRQTAQAKPPVIQPKAVATRPTAPPVYRPQHGRQAMQPRIGNALQGKTQPVAPPVYRPQPVPKVLQTKRASAGAVASPVAHGLPANAAPVYTQNQHRPGREPKPVAQQRTGRVSHPSGSKLATGQHHSTLKGGANAMGQRATMRQIAAQAKLRSAPSRLAPPVQASFALRVGDGRQRLVGWVVGSSQSVQRKVTYDKSSGTYDGNSSRPSWQENLKRTVVDWWNWATSSNKDYKKWKLTEDDLDRAHRISFKHLQQWVVNYCNDNDEKALTKNTDVLFEKAPSKETDKMKEARDELIAAHGSTAIVKAANKLLGILNNCTVNVRLGDSSMNRSIQDHTDFHFEAKGKKFSLSPHSRHYATNLSDIPSLSLDSDDDIQSSNEPYSISTGSLTPRSKKLTAPLLY